MFWLKILLVLLLSFPAFAEEKHGPKEKRCSLSNNICKKNSLIRDVCPKDLDCFQQSPTWIQLAYVECSRHLSNAWSFLYPDQHMPPATPQKASDELKLFTLKNNLEDNKKILQIIIKNDIGTDEFINKIKNAIEWSEKEKSLNKDVLYEKSKNNNDLGIHTEYHDEFNNIYLILAAKKKHPKAIKEILLLE